MIDLTKPRKREKQRNLQAQGKATKLLKKRLEILLKVLKWQKKFNNSSDLVRNKVIMTLQMQLKLNLPLFNREEIAMSRLGNSRESTKLETLTRIKKGQLASPSVQWAGVMVILIIMDRAQPKILLSTPDTCTLN